MFLRALKNTIISPHLRELCDRIYTISTSQIKEEYEQLEQNQLLSNQKVKQLELTISTLKNEKQALEKQLTEDRKSVV